MKNKEVAAAYGVKLTTVDHWPAQRREQAKADLATGFKPKVAEKLAQLVFECYRATMRTRQQVKCDFHFGFDDYAGSFDVWSFDGKAVQFLTQTCKLTTDNLQDLINQVKEL